MDGQGFAAGQTNYEYDTLMNLLQVSVSKHLLDEHFTLVWANDYYYDLIGYSREEYEALYRNRPDLYYRNEALGIRDGALWDQLGAMVLDALEQGKDGYMLVTRMRRKSGEYLWVRLTARFTEEYIGGCRVSYTAMTDITDVMRMQVEQSVTYDNLPGFAAKLRIGPDLRAELLDANERFFQFFGGERGREGECALFAENLARSRGVLLENREDLLAGRDVHFTVQMTGKDGARAWLQVNASCVERRDGDPVYLAIFIDITNETELRDMQGKLEAQAEQLRAALRGAEEANRAKSDFLSRMSHDIRTPLNAVLGMKDIACAHLDDPVKVRDCLHKIGLSGKHLLGLINDVLDMSKIESGSMALREDVVSLPEVMEDVVTILQPQFRERRQNFSIRLRQVAHEQFLSDSLRLRQIFLNVLSNACKFTPEGGSVTMEIQELSAQAGTAQYLFTIADTGIGMQPEFLAHLFDAFSRERDSRVDKTEGTGLGMAITKRLTELLGGSISVESRPGEGTAFRIRLPLKIEAPQSLERLPGLRVLVADDDDMLCEYTVELLERIGVQADWVRSGEEAVERVRGLREQGMAYDAALLDWQMPGQGGLEAARQIRALCGGSTPVLLISAYDWSGVEREAKEAGVAGFLQKPIFVSTLVRGLRRYVLGEEPGEEPPGDREDLRGRRLLLVEDNAVNREVAEALLCGLGASVECAGNGREGVEAFRRSPAGYYDLILMDIRMPVMDGHAAARAIRALDREDARAVPILAMTADAFAEDIRAAEEAGMDGHLAKPLDSAAMKREILRRLR